MTPEESLPPIVPPIVGASWGYDYEPGHPNASWGWIGTLRADLTPAGAALAEGRDRARFLGGVEDEDASYSFDDTAIVELDGVYYLAQTSGCSCPTHEENWNVTASGDLDLVERTLRDGDYHGYSYDHGELDVLLAIVARERAT